MTRMMVLCGLTMALVGCATETSAQSQALQRRQQMRATRKGASDAGKAGSATAAAAHVSLDEMIADAKQDVERAKDDLAAAEGLARASSNLLEKQERELAALRAREAFHDSRNYLLDLLGEKHHADGRTSAEGWQKAKWGMTRKAMEELYALTPANAFEATVANVSCAGVAAFDATGGLWGVDLFVRLDDDATLDEHLRVSEELKRLLTEKYGPSTDAYPGLSAVAYWLSPGGTAVALLRPAGRPLMLRYMSPALLDVTLKEAERTDAKAKDDL